MKSGTFSAGVLATADCKKTVEDLKKHGVKIASEPKPQPHAKLEALIVDDSGTGLASASVKPIGLYMGPPLR